MHMKFIDFTRKTNKEVKFTECYVKFLNILNNMNSQFG